MPPLQRLAQSFVSLFPAACMDDMPTVMLLDLVDKWSEEKTGLLGKMGDVLGLGLVGLAQKARHHRSLSSWLILGSVGLVVVGRLIQSEGASANDAAMAVLGIHQLMQHRETAGSLLIELLTKGGGSIGLIVGLRLFLTYGDLIIGTLIVGLATVRRSIRVSQ